MDRTRSSTEDNFESDFSSSSDCAFHMSSFMFYILQLLIIDWCSANIAFQQHSMRLLGFNDVWKLEPLRIYFSVSDSRTQGCGLGLKRVSRCINVSSRSRLSTGHLVLCPRRVIIIIIIIILINVDLSAVLKQYCSQNRLRRVGLSAGKPVCLKPSCELVTTQVVM